LLLSVEGELLGGDPPLLDIQEDLDVLGWKVYISRYEKFGGYLRDLDLGEIGKTVGKKGDKWIVKPTSRKKGLVIVGK
jgi:hypothetical protein